MLNHLFASGSVAPLEVLLAYAGARQTAIACNIANVDTVGYRSQDVPEGEFRRALERSFRGGEGSPAFHPVPSGGLKVGANNVDLELEMAKMVRTSALHAAAASLLANQFALVREAISGHVA